jgi:hypothetical protein
MPEPDLRERNATKVLADRPVMNRVAEAVSTATGLTYLDALDAYQNRLEALGPEATVESVLGTDAAQVLPLVKLLERNGERVHRTLEAAMPNAPEGERVRNLPSTSGRVLAQVLLPSNADHGKLLANPEEAERRLARARAHDPGGSFAGDDGRARFTEEDKEAIEQAWDLPRSLERDDEVRSAQRLAKNEAGKLARPVAETQAVRAEKRQLEQEIRRLDGELEANEAERAHNARRLVSNGRLAPIGTLLEARREASKRLEQIDADPRLQLDSIPGPGRTGEPPSGGLGIREKARKLQLEIDAATAYGQQHPEVPFLKALEMAERGEIRLSEDALRERRARRYLLDNNMGVDRFEEVLAAVRALED